MLGRKTIRFQLLVAVNLVMAMLLLAFLVLDYRREIADRVADKRVALDEEAKTLLPAVLRIRPQGIEAVQAYVDSVCGGMRDRFSPGHHIAVRLDGTVLQALAHHRSSPEIFEAMQAAARSPTRQANFGGEELVVGVDQQRDVEVLVSEHLTNVRRSVRKQVFPRLAGIALFTVAAATVISLVILRLVTRPLQQLVVTVRQIAEGRLDAQTGPFNSEEFTNLADAINLMSSSLAKAEQHGRQAMAKARQIQEHLLPNGIAVPGVVAAHLYQPAEDIAGDFYDVVGLSDGTWVLCVADVTGHGVPAAMSATMLKTLLFHASEHHTDLVQILRFINDRFSTVSLAEDFATMMLARWDPKAGTLEYASAGHEAAWFLPSRGPPRELPSTGWLLGVYEEATWETETLQVGLGDRLLFVTDGVTEAFDRHGALFGRERLVREFSRCRRTTVHDAVRQIDEALAAHRENKAPADDVTIVIAEFVALDT